MPLARRISPLPFLLLAPALLRGQLPDHVTPRGRARVARLGLEAVVGEVKLPVRWKGATVRLVAGESGLERPLLIPPISLYEGPRTRAEALSRIQMEDQQKAFDQFAGPRSIAKALAAYGQTHGGRGPATLEDPEFQKSLTDRQRSQLAGFALVPKADLADAEAPLLLELAPRIDDGQHWIFTTALQPERRPVDAELLRRLGQKLRRDRIAALPPLPPGPEERVPFQVIGLRRGPATSAKLEVMKDGQSLGTFTFTFPTVDAPNAEGLEAWLRARCVGWSTEAPLAAGLWMAAESAYGGAGLKLGVGLEQMRHQRNRGGIRGEAEPGGPSMLALLGGRAAVDETLQLDRALADADQSKDAELPLSELPGIDTPPHPWAEMRKGKPAPALLPLADCVPLDRPLLHLRKPADALASLEGGGATFLSRVNSFLGQDRLDTSIVERALADLGLGSGLGRRIVAAGGVKEAVIFSSDLAFLAGTELTLVAELAPMVGALLPLPQEGIQPRGAAFWAKRGNRLFISTSRTELSRALALHDVGGKGSLGRSDEFAVVLGELAPGADTEVYAYLPDAFIRNLVGPRQRILQSRQALARLQMERLAAAALLRRMDAPDEPVTLERLRSLGYLPNSLNLSGLTLEADGRVRHRDFGALEHLNPLERIPLARVSEGEAQAYAAFREGYSRYWRRYFDPIAFRLDAASEGRMSLETFVLPLLDSSIYQGLKGIVAAGDRPRPRWTVPMVAEFGLKARPQAFGARGPLGRILDLPGVDLTDSFTGSMAVGFPDSAPVIQMGSGSPATLMDAGALGRGSDMITLGAVALGAFTRPLVLALELKQPATFARDLQFLGAEGLPLPRLFRELEGRVTREPDGRLLVRLGFLGLASMRFTAHVEDRWLVLSNDASLASPLVAGTEAPSPFPTAFRLQPSAVKAGLPAAFQAAMEGDAKAAWGAMAWLMPWLQSGQSPEAARAESHRLLGLAPFLANGDLEVQGAPVHARFGTAWRPRTPAFDPTGRFGIFEGVTSAEVSLGFEGDGLRARVTWTR